MSGGEIVYQPPPLVPLSFEEGKGGGKRGRGTINYPEKPSRF